MARLSEDLESSLMDMASIFDGNLFLLLSNALLDFSRVRRRTLAGKVALIAGQVVYDCPADFISFGVSYWGASQRQSIKPWEPGYPQRTPRARVMDSDNGKQLLFDAPPSAGQIASLGAEYAFTYYASHVISEDGDKTTVSVSDRDLLLLRAQAEAMRFMANRNIKKPVASREAISGQTRNGTPAALYDFYLKQFNEMAARC